MTRRRLVTIAGVAAVALGPLALPAAAQDEPISVKPFVLVGLERFAASQTFTAAFGNSRQPLVGGGVDVIIHQRWFAGVTFTRFARNGERAFVADGGTFGLGIPLNVTLTAVELSGGVRFGAGSARVIPYVGAGAGSYGYAESSDAGGSDTLDARHVGYLGLGGAEFRVGRWLGVSGDLQYIHLPGVFGAGGVSKLAGEGDLGGLTVRVRVLVGR